MNQVIDVLNSLGVNETVFPQFAIFIVSFLFLKIFIFSPYLAAYEERRKRTVGSQGVALELQQEIDRREAEFSREAKEINEKIKKVFDMKQAQAVKETNAILAEAQLKAQERLNAGKKEVQDAYDAAKDQLKNFVPDLGQTIKQRLLDR
jgi:F0F1-type ATP synthase membrane subunit b/b'